MKGLGVGLIVLMMVALYGCGGQNQPPTAQFEATPLTGDAPLTVDVDASSSSDPDGQIASYSWQFGDSSSGDGGQSSHTYDQPGEYTIRLEVKDNKGDSATSTMTVTVNEAVVIEPNFEIAQSAFRLQGCGGCHTLVVGDLSYQGTVGPDLSAEGLRNRTDEWLRKQLTDPTSIPDDEVAEGFAGKQSIMPSYSNLSAEELVSLIAFLQSLTTESASTTTTVPTTVSTDNAVEVAKSIILAQGCGSCHTLSNEDFKLTGTVGPDLTNEANRNRTKAWLIQKLKDPTQIPDEQVVEGFEGMQMVMPSYGRILSDEELNALADYLLSLNAND